MEIVIHAPCVIDVSVIEKILNAFALCDNQIQMSQLADISAIEIKLVGDMGEESEPERYYYWTNWVGDEDTNNPAQSTYVNTPTAKARWLPIL